MGQPTRRGGGAQRRAQQNIIAVAFTKEEFDIIVGLAGFYLLPDQPPQILGKGRIAVIDGLVLADKAPKLGRKTAGTFFQPGIGKAFFGQKCCCG